MYTIKSLKILKGKFIYLNNIIRKNQVVVRKRNQLNKENIQSDLKDLELKVHKIKKDPSNTKVVLFAGEGSEYLGMSESCLDYPNVYDFFKKAEDFYGFNLIDLCLNEPNNELRKFKYLMPCIFLSNIAALEKLKLEEEDLMQTTVATTGFGLGELNSLFFNNVISFENALNILKINSENLDFLASNSFTRSICINYSAKTNLNLLIKSTKQWCINKNIKEEHAICEVTHYLYPECKIIGAHIEGIKFIEHNVKLFGIKKLTNLNYPIALNSSLIKPLRNILKNYLKNIKYNAPTIKIHSCIGKLYTERNIVDNLSKFSSLPMRIEKNFTDIYRRDKLIELPVSYECTPSSFMREYLKKANYRAYKNSKVMCAN